MPDCIVHAYFVSFFIVIGERVLTCQDNLRDWRPCTAKQFCIISHKIVLNYLFFAFYSVELLYYIIVETPSLSIKSGRFEFLKKMGGEVSDFSDKKVWVGKIGGCVKMREVSLVFILTNSF